MSWKLDVAVTIAGSSPTASSGLPMMRVPEAPDADGEASCASAVRAHGTVQNAPATAAAPVIFARARRDPVHADIGYVSLYAIYAARQLVCTITMMNEARSNNKESCPLDSAEPGP